MNKLSKFDELGFIPYENENLEKYGKRCEKVLSLKDKIYEKFGNRLVDASNAIKILKKYCKVEPNWIPVVKKRISSRGKSEMMKMSGVKIPVVDIHPEHNTVDVTTHEIVHSFREPLYQKSSLQPCKVCEEEFMTSHIRVEENLKGVLTI